MQKESQRESLQGDWRFRLFKVASFHHQEIRSLLLSFDGLFVPPDFLPDLFAAVLHGRIPNVRVHVAG